MKTLFTALIMGLCGAIAVSISFAAGWPTWVMFLAWVSYYIFGKSIRAAVTSLSQITAGIAMGICISLVAKNITPVLGALGFPFTVFILIGSLAYLSKIKGLGNIPAWFIGLIIFFGIHPEIKLMPIMELVTPIIAGFVFASINDYGIRLIHINNNQETIQ